MQIISNDVCKQQQVYGNEIKRGMFCAGYLEGIYDACRVGWGEKITKATKLLPSPGNIFMYFMLAQHRHSDISKCVNVIVYKYFKCFIIKLPETSERFH